MTAPIYMYRRVTNANNSRLVSYQFLRHILRKMGGPLGQIALTRIRHNNSKITTWPCQKRLLFAHRLETAKQML